MGLRQQRLADEIRDILAVCFQGDQMQDPRLHNVTITAVKLSGDLQQAAVYFRFIDEGKPGDEPDRAKIETVHQGLDRASGFLRRRIAEGTFIRRVPAIRFVYDESVERGARIEGLLSKLD